jgi:murein DD-endopeptidase MepM/ murein hydrolase activator NlpD
MSTTSSLPVPPESVYSPERYHYYGDPNSGMQISRSSPPSLHPDYSPMPRSRAGSYAAQRAPRSEPVMAKASGLHIKVQRGDTLFSLSRRYGVSVETIQSANNLADARLSEGQELIIPGAHHEVAALEPAPAPRASAPARPGETAYTVEKGDTPHSIAEKLGANENAIIARNNVRPDDLQIGQKLIIPRGSAPAVAWSQSARAALGVRKVKTTTIPAPGSGKGSGEASPDITGRDPQRLASTDQRPSPDPMSGNSFRWPVEGRIISGFGTKPDGGHNDGINISVPQGTPVKAAENGVVAYAGNELKGYGNLVLIRHANNWVSAYANNEAILVKRGDKVRRGQIIAKAGATGSVTQPQVHFELRKGSRPVDPTKYMTSTTASAD